MPTEFKLPLWQKVTGYVLFGVITFILCLFITFPHQAFWLRVKDAATSAGFFLRVDDYGASFGGITAYGVKLSKIATGAESAPPPSIDLDSLAIRPTLFPPGVTFKAKGFGGNINGTVNGFALMKVGSPPPKDKAAVAGQANVNLTLSHLDLSSPTIKAFSGVDLAGVVDGSLDLDIPVAGNPGAPAYELDLSQANGDLRLEGEALTINGGTITVPMMGEPTPMDLPKVVLGELDGTVKFVKGLGTVETLTSKSDELEFLGTGTLKLARKFEYSEPSMDLKLKAESALVSRLGLIGSGLSILPMDPQKAGFRVARWSGFLNRPRFGPGRKTGANP